MSIEELCNFLFEGYKLRYPDDKNETLDLVLINTDTELDEIYSCHASSYDIKGQLVLWNWRNFQLLKNNDNQRKGATEIPGEYVDNIYKMIMNDYRSNKMKAHELVCGMIKTNRYVKHDLKESDKYFQITDEDWMKWYEIELNHGKFEQ